MKLNRKSALFTLMLLMSAIWCYDVYMQQSNANYWSEISSEDTSSIEVQDSDVEISEEDQISHKTIFLPVLTIAIDNNHFYISPRLNLPISSPWQPPQTVLL